MRNFLFLLFIVGLTAFCMSSCNRPMTEPMMDAITTVEVPTMDDPAAFAVAFVQGALDLYEAEGLDATIARYNDPMSIEGQWYVYGTDPSDIFTIHPVLPHQIGTDLKNIIGLDGQPIGADIAEATTEGLWVEYLWHNPETNKLARKRSWSIRNNDGYLFGTGYYEPWHPDPLTLPTVSKDDPEAFTVSVIHEAIARYEFHGLEATLDYYNDPANIDGQWYVVIVDPNDIFIAHPQSPDFVENAVNLNDVYVTHPQDPAIVSGNLNDPRGYPAGAELAKTTGAGLWSQYVWPNPATGEEELKRTWSIRHDGYFFATGYYEPLPKVEEPAEAN